MNVTKTIAKHLRCSCTSEVIERALTLLAKQQDQDILTLQEKLEEQANLIDRQASIIDEQDEEINNLKDRMDQHITKNSELEEEIKIGKKERDEMKAEIREWEIDAGEMEDSTDREISRLDTENAELKAQLAEIKRESMYSKDLCLDVNGAIIVP